MICTSLSVVGGDSQVDWLSDNCGPVGMHLFLEPSKPFSGLLQGLQGTQLSQHEPSFKSDQIGLPQSWVTLLGIVKALNAIWYFSGEL